MLLVNIIFILEIHTNRYRWFYHCHAWSKLTEDFTKASGFTSSLTDGPTLEKVRYSTSQINGQSVVPRINLIARINRLSSGIEITFN